VGRVCTFPFELRGNANVPQLFTLGSAIWVVNGFFSFLPSVYSNIPVYGYWLGYTGLAGGTVFEIGAYMMVLESLNRKQVVWIPTLEAASNGSCVSATLVNHSIDNAHTISTIPLNRPRVTRVKRNKNGFGGVLAGQKLDFWQV